ncbi:hypothetical protein BT69DRAFT_1275358 [Atractiella rhizophila]|nr:hypothetical protein BT69DRAFT_1275358 [Atractiella rhizophila]
MAPEGGRMSSNTLLDMNLGLSFFVPETSNPHSHFLYELSVLANVPYSAEPGSLMDTCYKGLIEVAERDGVDVNEAKTTHFFDTFDKLWKPFSSLNQKDFADAVLPSLPYKFADVLSDPSDASKFGDNVYSPLHVEEQAEHILTFVACRTGTPCTSKFRPQLILRAIDIWCYVLRSGLPLREFTRIYAYNKFAREWVHLVNVMSWQDTTDCLFYSSSRWRQKPHEGVNFRPPAAETA